MENFGNEFVDENVNGGLDIWIDGELEWTYNWSTWDCQDFRNPGGFCTLSDLNRSGITMSLFGDPQDERIW